MTKMIPRLLFSNGGGKEVQAGIESLLAKGIVRPTGERRDGQPVYELVPEAEQTEEAREYNRRLNQQMTRKK